MTRDELSLRIDHEQVKISRTVKAPCGNTAHYDPESSYPAWRCGRCFAVLGSIGMPDECREMQDK